jgi:hypothetical protein
MSNAAAAANLAEVASPPKSMNTNNTVSALHTAIASASGKPSQPSRMNDNP